MDPSINRALIYQGGGSLGAYEAGAYKAIREDLSKFLRIKGKENEPIFHIVSGTSMGSINDAILVSYVDHIPHFTRLEGALLINKPVLVVLI